MRVEFSPQEKNLAFSVTGMLRFPQQDSSAFFWRHVTALPKTLAGAHR